MQGRLEEIVFVLTVEDSDVAYEEISAEHIVFRNIHWLQRALEKMWKNTDT